MFFKIYLKTLSYCQLFTYSSFMNQIVLNKCKRPLLTEKSFKNFLGSGGSDGSLIKHQTMYQMHIMYFQARNLYMFIANSIQAVEDCCHLMSIITSDMSDRCVCIYMSQTVTVDMQSHNLNAQTSQREIP